MIFFYLLEIVSSLIVKIKLSTVAFVRSVMISVLSWMVSARLIHFIGSAKTAKTSFKILSVDMAKTDHIKGNDKVLEELGYLFEGEFREFD